MQKKRNKRQNKDQKRSKSQETLKLLPETRVQLRRGAPMFASATGIILEILPSGDARVRITSKNHFPIIRCELCYLQPIVSWGAIETAEMKRKRLENDGRVCELKGGKLEIFDTKPVSM
jgi:hypothetical protein